MTNMYDQEDELNLNPAAEHDEWEQAIKDDKTLIPVNERYRIRQYPTMLETGFEAELWCGTCNVAIDTEDSALLSVFLEAAKAHEAEVHSEDS